MMTVACCPYDNDQAQEMLLPKTTGDPVPAEVEDHLRDCSLCRERLTRLQAEVSTMRDMFRTGSLSIVKTPTPTGRTDEWGAFGPYRVVGKLGPEGTAETYRAVHAVLGQEVVLKIGPRAVARSSLLYDRLVAEARRLAEINDPGVARVYNLEFFQERPCMVREYVPGRSLEDYLSDEAPSSQRVASLVAALARTLGRLHRQGAVHQTIHPRNVVIDEDNKPHLLDCGSARLRSLWDAQAEKLASGDARGDIFALGAMLFSLLLGKPFAQVQRNPSTLRRANAPRRLKAICWKALAVSSAGQYASADELADDLESHERGSGKHRWLTRWLPAAVLLAGLLAAIGWLWSALAGW
jgi:serine/threonine-protein kinase